MSAFDTHQRYCPSPFPSGDTQGTDSVLLGFHREAAEWIKLTKIEGNEDAEVALMSCHSKTQPFKKRLSIVWDDFSAFKIEEYIAIQGYRT